MADEYILKSYDGGAETTTLTTPFTVGGTTLGVANGSTFPDGSAGPFVIVVDRGLASEEKFLIDTTTGVNGTTFNIQQVAYDGTSASAHSVGAVVEHCLDAYSIEQANRYVNLQTTRGDLVSRSTTTTGRLAAGTNNHVLMADSTQTLGLKYAEVGTGSIADGAIVTAKIGDSQVTAGKLASASVTASKISTAVAGTTGQVLTVNTSAASGLEWQSTALPTGTIVQYAGTSAPSGWLICDGTAVSRTTYSSLFSLLQVTYGIGNGTTTFNLPNLQGRVAVGVKASDADFNAVGKTFGSKTHTLITDQMPVHSHGPGADTTARPVEGFVGYEDVVGGQANNDAATFNDSGGFLLRALSTTAGAGGSGSPRTTQPHNIVQESLVLNYIIKF